jgi:hypothetical protein
VRKYLRFSWQTTLTVAGVLLLVAWALVWAVSLQRNHLVGARHTWVQAWQFLGLDFLSNYHAVQHWLAGGNPYREPFGDPLDRPICYPPVILPLFAWAGCFSPRAATAIWTIALAALASLGAVMAWRTRRALALGAMPLPLVLAATLCSTPVLFAMERGNWDLLVLAPLALTAFALKEPTWQRDCLAGTCLALAAWIKLYPGLLFLSLLVYRRYRAFAICLLCATLLGLAAVPDRHYILANMKSVAAINMPDSFHPTAHTFSAYWPLCCEALGLNALGQIDGLVAALVLGVPVVLGVSWCCCCCRRRPGAANLAYPYLLWLAGAATFFPVSSNDYNLFFLPLAALALWSRRDGVLVNVMMALMVLWWQPLRLPIHPNFLFAFKLAGFAATSLCLIRRAREAAKAKHGGPLQSLVPSPPARVAA